MQFVLQTFTLLKTFKKREQINMKEKLTRFLAHEGLTVEQLHRFEQFYDVELKGEATLEILKQAKAQVEAENKNKLDITAIAEEMSLRK